MRYLSGQLNCKTSKSERDHCGSGFSREHRRSRCHAARWTLRGHARSHRYRADFRFMRYLSGQLNCKTSKSERDHCGSGFSREHRRSRCHAARWTLRGHARSHRYRADFRFMRYLSGQLNCKTSKSERDHCGSGFSREHRRSRCHAARWTLRGHARSHRYRADFRFMRYLSGQLNCKTSKSERDHCGSGFSREHRRSRCHAARWTLRGHARSHRYRADFRFMRYLSGQLNCKTSESERDHCGSGLAPRTRAKPVPSTPVFRG